MSFTAIDAAAVGLLLGIAVVGWILVRWSCADADLGAARRQVVWLEQQLQNSRAALDRAQRSVRDYQERMATISAAARELRPLLTRNRVPAAQPSPEPAPPPEPPLPPPHPRGGVEYAVIQVQRDEVLDAVRAWLAKTGAFLELLPVPESAATLRRTLVAELGTLVHRLDGTPADLVVEVPAVVEPSAVAHSVMENAMPREFAVSDAEAVDVGLLVRSASEIEDDDPIDEPDDADDFDDDDDDFDDDDDDFDDDDADDDFDDDDDDFDDDDADDDFDDAADEDDDAAAAS